MIVLPMNGSLLQLGGLSIHRALPNTDVRVCSQTNKFARFVEAAAFLTCVVRASRKGACSGCLGHHLGLARTPSSGHGGSGGIRTCIARGMGCYGVASSRNILTPLMGGWAVDV